MGEGTFAGTRGNDENAPIPAIRASESESETATDTRRSAQCDLVAPSTFVLPSARYRGVPYGFRNAVSAS
jgi:hypothetical protein